MVMLLGVILLMISGILFLSLFYNNDYMCKNEIEKYKVISDKVKSERTNEEQDLIDKTWHIYWSMKVSKHSFVIGILLIAISILFSKVMGNH